MAKIAALCAVKSCGVMTKIFKTHIQVNLRHFIDFKDIGFIISSYYLS